MFKKIILLAAVIATYSFATWDYFGLLQNSQGSFKAGLYYDTDDDWSQMGLRVAARMNVTPQFELSLQGFGYQFWGETDCDACAEGGSGLKDLAIGARFALDPELYLFLDFNLPIGKDKAKGYGTTAPSSHEMYIYAGAQHHKDISSIKGAAYGTEAGLFWGFEHHDRERGLELRLGGEFDYTLPSAPVTLLVGGQFWLRLFKSEYYNGNKDMDLHDDWSNQFKFWLGVSLAATDDISINGQIIARSQDLKKKAKDNGVQIGMEGDALGFVVDVEFKF